MSALCRAVILFSLLIASCSATVYNYELERESYSVVEGEDLELCVVLVSGGPMDNDFDFTISVMLDGK